MNPRVSVCTSVLNQSEMLKGMIESVVAQAFKDWELVLVDDASTEDIKAVADSFNDPRIKYHRFDENRKGRFPEAVGLATGEFINVLAADERITPDKLAWQVTFMDEYPDIDGIWGLPQNGEFGLRPEWEQYALRAHNRSAESWIRTLLTLDQIPIGGASWLVKKSVLDELGMYNRDLYCTADLELFIRFFEKGYKGKILPYRWTSCVDNPGSMSNTRKPEEFQEEMRKVHALHPMPKPKRSGRVTIGIPIKNMSQWLPETLKSLEAQTCQDFDVIVFDDGSAVKVIVPDDGRTQLIRVEESIGPLAAQNHMLAMCNTDFFCVLAADDTLAPTFIEKCLREFANNPWLEFVASQTDFMGADGKDLADHPFKSIMKASNKTREQWLQVLYYGNNYFGCGMYRTQAAKDVGGWDPNVGVLGDYDMYLKLLQRENIHIIEENLTHTRAHDSNRSILKTRKEQQQLREHYHEIKSRYYHPRMKVIIATPFYEMRGFSPYINSMVGTIQLLTRYGIQHEFWELSGDSYVDRAKNTLMAKFLEDPEATDFFLIDSDMQWNPDGFMRMLLLPEEIVMGSYPQKNAWDMWTARPFLEKEQGSDRVSPIGRMLEDGNAVIKAEYLAGGFIRIKRSALLAFKEKFGHLTYEDRGADPMAPDRTYTEFFTCERAQLNGEGPYLRWGEDRVFGKRMREIGIDTWIYPNIDFGHYGVKGWTGNFDSFLRGNVKNDNGNAGTAPSS